jgi:twitching motility protein PilJ
VARNFYEKSSRALSEYYALYDSGRTTVSALLTKRVETLQRQKLLQMAIVMVALAVAAFMVLSISRGIAKQTNAISRLFAEISAGNLNARASVFSNDELGQIAQELNFMLDDILQLIESREEKERIQANIVKLLDEVSGVAAGDLTRDAEVTSDVTGAIADSFNYMLAELRQIIASVQSTTAAVTGSATEVQHTASQLAYGSKAQSQALVDASAAIADMAKSIQQVSQSAGRAAHIAERALEDAKGGAATVGRTINGMNAIRGRVQETSKRIKRLGESSQEIGEIVRLIGDIADRTSILALNASIQASTAGEAGKGFAVVAEEVERLAVRAAESAKKISAIIKSVQSDTTEAVAAMEETTREVVNGSQLANEAGQRLRDIEGVSQQIAELIAQISDASRKQAAGSEEVSRNVTGISQFTQQTASGAQLTEASTRKLADLALELNASISRFKLPEGA